MQSRERERIDPPQATLDTLRAEIDRLDDRLLELVEQRLAASKAIAERKNDEGKHLLKMRPRREASVIARLVSKASIASPELIDQLWRTLMSHGLQAQVATEIVLCAEADRASLQEQVRTRFGSGPSIRWVEAPADAIAAARQDEAVAVIENGLPFALEEGDSLVMFDCLHDAEGHVRARVFGRVAADEVIVAEPAPQPAMEASR